MLAAGQRFQKHSMHFVWMSYKDEGLFKNVVIFVFSQCSQTWRGSLNRMDGTSLLLRECGVLAETIDKSGVPHLTVSLEFFAARRFITAETIGAVLQNHGIQKPGKRYGEVEAIWRGNHIYYFPDVL